MGRRRKKGNPITGWLVLDKPLEMTSTAAVGRVRWLLQAQKAGHAGTLDPLATGLLPIALGEATKTVPFVMDADKTYEFTIQWGQSTDSQDAEGAVIATSDVRPSREAIENALPQFTGEIQQVPPKYSAIKVNGERAYDLARDGEEVELEARPITVYTLEVVDIPDADHCVLRMCCGKGGYVRALARDLCAVLGTEGHVTALRRTQLGAFAEARAISLDSFEKMCNEGRALEALVPIATALDDIPAVAVTGPEASHLRQGRAIALLPHVRDELRAQHLDHDPTGDDRWVLAMAGQDEVALCEARAGQLSPKRVFIKTEKPDVDYTRA